MTSQDNSVLSEIKDVLVEMRDSDRIIGSEARIAAREAKEAASDAKEAAQLVGSQLNAMVAGLRCPEHATAIADIRHDLYDEKQDGTPGMKSGFLSLLEFRGRVHWGLGAVWAVVLLLLGAGLTAGLGMVLR